jgi:thiamine pyrophosphate-dependent acetolactate synthase large subunit-like protein
MRVFQSISDALKNEGVEIVFALMGDANQNLIVDLAERLQVRIINFRHEQNAVAAADGFARFSRGKLGVAIVTMGPGLTNTATSLAAAKAHRSAVLVLAGAASLGEFSNPQRFDQVAFSRLLAGSGELLETPGSVGPLLDRAMGHLRRHLGPFVLNLPGGVQNASMPEAWSYSPAYASYQPVLPTASALETAVSRLAAARKPAILIGRGAVNGDAEAEICELATFLQAPIATTLQAKGFCSEHPLWVGVSGGLGEGVALPVLADCDMLLVVGASLNQWTTHHGDLVHGKSVVQIDSELESFGAFTPSGIMLCGDARETVKALLDRLRGSELPERSSTVSLQSRIEAGWKKYRAPIAYLAAADNSIDPRQAVREFDQLLPDKRLVVVAGAHAGYLVCQLLRVSSPHDWNYTIDFGALGQGLATAIGASFARPGERVYHLTCDGEFMMNLADFHTAVLYRLPLTIVVLNDQGFGQERHDLEHKDLPISYAMQASPDFAKLAEGFGARGFRFATPESLNQLREALKIAEAFQGPTVFDIRINGAYESPVSQEIAKALV